MTLRISSKIVCPIMLILCAMIAGCAPMSWNKPGTSRAVAEEDADKCWEEAYRQATRYPTSSAPIVSANANGQVSIITSPATMQSEQTQQAFDRMQTCMHQKGYLLGPLKSEPGN